ncbi:MAG: HAMP domain-containing protein, partial [Parvibaculaceae bacterium]
MLKKLKSLKIKGRIFIGFGAVLALTLVIGATSIIKTNSLVGGFHDYRGIASDTVIVSEINTDMAKVLFHTSKYMDTGAAESLANTEKNLESLRKHVGAAEKDMAEPELAEKVRQITGLVGGYTESLKEISTLYTERDGIVSTTIEQTGPALRAEIEKLSAQATRAGQDAASTEADAINLHLMRARLNVAKYLANAQPKDIETAIAELSIAIKQFGALGNAASNPDWQAAVASIDPKLKAYLAAATRLGELVSEAEKLRVEKIEKDGRAVDALTNQIEATAIENGKALAATMLANSSAAMTALLLVLAVALAAGAGLAILITRSIVRPVDAMTTAMTELAAGDKTVEVPSQDRRDEIGSMAKAVQVFKENMIENARLAAEKLDADKRAAERDEKAREEKQKAEEERLRLEEEGRQKQRDEMLALAEEFEKGVGHIIQSVSSAAHELQASAQALSSTADQASAKSASVAAASEEATTNVQTVA